MHLVAILEVAPDSDKQLPSDLLRAAYKASRRGPVALLVPNGAAPAIDRELYAVVAANRFVHGVRYARATDASLWNSATAATVVVADSSDVQRRAEKIGAGCVDLSSGVAALNRLSAAC